MRRWLYQAERGVTSRPECAAKWRPEGMSEQRNSGVRAYYFYFFLRDYYFCSTFVCSGSAKIVSQIQLSCFAILVYASPSSNSVCCRQQPSEYVIICVVWFLRSVVTWTACSEFIAYITFLKTAVSPCRFGYCKINLSAHAPRSTVSFKRCPFPQCTD